MAEQRTVLGVVRRFLEDYAGATPVKLKLIDAYMGEYMKSIRTLKQKLCKIPSFFALDCVRVRVSRVCRFRTGHFLDAYTRLFKSL